MSEKRFVWGLPGKAARIYSATTMPRSLVQLSDLERGVLVGEGREAVAREERIRFRFTFWGWIIEVHKEEG
jgi:hypothetical protein